MIRYAYNRQVEPPAPFVHVTLLCADTGLSTNEIPALLDTAADRTVIPASLVSRLGLVPMDEVSVAGFGGQVVLIPTYFVELSIRTLTPLPLEVLAHPEEPYVLLGRDVLNRHRLVLDGPGLALEIS
jgi:hypothetical protein